MKATLSLLSLAAVLTAIASFWLLIADSTRLHGDALSGSADGGHYFVADHGRRTEVSEDDWRRSRALGILAITTFPLGMLGGFYILFAVAFPKFAFRAPADERDSRVRGVVASGPALASTRCSGSFGWFSAGGGMVRAEVHPDGLVVRVLFIGRVALRRDEIRAVREGSQFRIRYVEVEHASSHVVSPIRLSGVRDVAFVAALRGLAEHD